MVVYFVEIRYDGYTKNYITASKDRADKELREADKNNVGVIVTPYYVEDYLTLN